MKIIPQSDATINQPPTAKVNKVEAAIKAFENSQKTQEQKASPQAQQHPVQNPTKVAPEEMSAITPTSQTDSNATPQTSATEVTPVNDPLSSQYAILAKKERAHRQRVQELQAQQNALKAEKDALAAKEVEYQSKYLPKDRITSDPLGVLQEMGVTYEQLTQLILNSPNTPQGNQESFELRQLRDEIKLLKSSQDQVKKSIEDQQTQNYQQALNQIRSEAEQLVSSDPTYEVARHEQAVPAIVKLIEKTFQQDGILMTVEEAAIEVENYLTEKAIKNANLGKIRAKLQASQATSQKPVEQQSSNQQQSMKTLTNAVNASRPLSRRDRAIAAMEGRLKG